MYQRALYKAIQYFGSQDRLARAIGVRQQSISNWLNREHSIPYKQVIKIVAATDGLVSVHELAPEEKQLNKAIDKLIKSNFLKIAQIPIEKIKENPQVCLHDNGSFVEDEINQEILRLPLLVDKNFQLLDCNCKLYLRQQIGCRSVFAKIIHDE